MDSFNVIMAPRAIEQLDAFIDYIQYTLLNDQAAKSVYVGAVYHQQQDYENSFAEKFLIVMKTQIRMSPCQRIW